MLRLCRVVANARTLSHGHGKQRLFISMAAQKQYFSNAPTVTAERTERQGFCFMLFVIINFLFSIYKFPHVITRTCRDIGWSVEEEKVTLCLGMKEKRWLPFKAR